MRRQPENGRLGHRIGVWGPCGLTVLLALVYGPGLLRATLLAGDLPGHLESIRWSATHLWPLPWGWDPRYLGGAPIGVLYPPALSWVGGGLAQWVGAESALRALLLGSVLALPASLAAAGRGFGLRRSEAGWAAIAGILVLWLPGRGLGGSLHQTLVAGNAANAMALPLLLVFLGGLRRTIGRPCRWPRSAAVLGVLLLTHFLMATAAGVALLAWGLRGRRAGSRARLGRMLATGGAASLAAAPFLLPFAVHLPDLSRDALVFAPPPSVFEWMSLAMALGLLWLGGRASRRALGPALVVLAVLLAGRVLVFPWLGAPPVRMEYHRFRLLLYLAVVPLAAFPLRHVRKGAWTAMLGTTLLAALAAVALAFAYDARGPAPPQPPGRRPDLGGARLLVLACPRDQNGSWHGTQLRLPALLGATGLKGLFVEASPLSRKIFEMERAAAAPGHPPRWWAIRTDGPARLDRMETAELGARARELALGHVLAREPVSTSLEGLATSREDLGAGYALYTLPPAPLVSGGAGSTPSIPFRVSRDGSRIDVELGPRSTEAVVAVSASSDWRVEKGRARLSRAGDGRLGVAGTGSVTLAVRPRVEEWCGLALGAVGWTAIAWGGRACSLRRSRRGEPARARSLGMRRERTAIRVGLAARRAVPNVLLVAGSLLGCAVALEFVCRVIASQGDWYAAGPSRQTFLRSHVRRNGDGFRDRAFTPARSPGVVRLLALGDSFTFGDGIERVEDTWPRVLERLLTEEGLRCEVLNLGVPGTNTAYQRRVLRRTGYALRPDRIVLGFVLNDPEPPGANLTAIPERIYLPLLPWRGLDARLTRISHAYAWARGSKNGLMERFGAKESYSDYVRKLYRPGHDWDAFVQEARGLVDEAGAHGAPLTVAVFPLLDDLGRDPFRLERSRVVRLFSGAGVDVLDLWEAFRGRPEDRVRLSRLNPHPSVEGHRVAAQALARHLVPLLRAPVGTTPARAVSEHRGDSENSVNEGRQRASRRQHDHEAEEEQDQHDRQQPELLPVTEELP